MIDNNILIHSNNDDVIEDNVEILYPFMKTPILKKGTAIKILVALLLLSSIPQIWLHSPILGVVAVVLSATLFFIVFCANGIAKLFNVIFVKKPDCPFYFQIKCPYGKKEQCPYDAALCSRFRQNSKPHRVSVTVGILLTLSLICTIVNALITNGVSTEEFGKLSTWVSILSPIANSIIAAILCAIVMDIPSRMAEYQGYFINLLSSADYLKEMDENQLVELRNKVTWQMHIKDVPRMPKGLIRMDQEILNMLKQPYYKTYNQHTDVKPCLDFKGMLKKIVRVDYIAHNPYENNHPIRMDIGMAFSIKLNDDMGKDSSEEIEKWFKINKFDITIDSSDSHKNILPYIKAIILEKREDGLDYNCKLQLCPRSKNKENYIDLSKELDLNSSGLKYEKTDEEDNALFISFSDKIHVHIEFEICTREDDYCFSKRLRYPVKYFYLDYTIDKDLNYQLSGQLIGTMIDQSDVKPDILDDGKRICLRTHSWLLPKNGAIIVHRPIVN